MTAKDMAYGIAGALLIPLQGKREDNKYFFHGAGKSSKKGADFSVSQGAFFYSHVLYKTTLYYVFKRCISSCKLLL